VPEGVQLRHREQKRLPYTRHAQRAYSPRRVIARPEKIQRLRNGFPHTTSPPLAARQPQEALLPKEERVPGNIAPRPAPAQ
jgi:hypothetical protein